MIGGFVRPPFLPAPAAAAGANDTAIDISQVPIDLALGLELALEDGENAVEGAVFAVAIAAASLLLASVVHAGEMNDFTQKLPRGYVGEFRWEGDPTVQNVVIVLDELKPLNGKHAEALGCGSYEVGPKVTKIKVRMLVKLRVQNPNDAPVEYDGVYLKLDVQNSTFATGVSDERGSVPRFGESVIAVPVTVSTLRLVGRALGFLLDGRPMDKVTYKMDGKLDGPVFGSTRFQAEGEFNLPTALPATKP